VCSEKFSYTEVKNMTFPEVFEACAALDEYGKSVKKQMDEGQKNLKAKRGARFRGRKFR
jgi:hypothetical protein